MTDTDYDVVKQQLQAQIDAINAEMNASIPDQVKQKLVQNKDKLQSWYNQFLSGVGITDANLAQLTSDLDNAHKDVLAASAKADMIKMIVIASASVVVIGVIIYLIRRKKIKS